MKRKIHALQQLLEQGTQQPESHLCGGIEPRQAGRPALSKSACGVLKRMTETHSSVNSLNWGTADRASLGRSTFA